MFNRGKIKYLVQSSMVECGSTCLAMIAGYHGLSLSVEDANDLVQPGRDGTSARQLSVAGRKLGLEVLSYATEASNLVNFTYPAIAHWGFNHFVVIFKANADGSVLIADPAIGKRLVPAREVSQYFTGVLLTFGRGVNFSRARNRKQGRSNVSRYASILYSIPTVKSFLLTMACFTAILQVTGLVLPLFTKVMVDTVLPQGQLSILPVLLIAILLFSASQAVIRYVRGVLILRLRTVLDTTVVAGFFSHLLKLRFSFFQFRTSGDIVSRLNSNITLRDMLTNQVVSTFIDTALIILYLAVLFWQSPLFSLLTLALGCCIVATILLSFRKSRQLVQDQIVSKANMDSYQYEVLRGIKLIKATGYETTAYQNWTTRFYQNVTTSLNKDGYFLYIDELKGLFEKFAPFVLLWLGITAVLNQTMTLGTMLALIALAGAFLAPLASLANNIHSFQQASVHLDRVLRVVDEEIEQKTGKEINPTFSITGEIVVDHLSFRYGDGRSPWVLQDISLHIQPGEKVAVVGATGAGKSTFAALFLGMYHPQQGTIRYDGVDLFDLDLSQLRRQLGVVLQEPFLFNTSIRKNIGLYSTSTQLNEIIRAAKIANVHDDIIRMPMGYDTIVSEGGTSVSGGQRQRIALARAIVNNPKILILDEATSSLDVRCEQAIDQAVAQLRCTQIIISHRPSTIAKADRIVILDGGKLSAVGTHEELLANNEDYQSLFGDPNREKNKEWPILSNAPGVTMS